MPCCCSAWAGYLVTGKNCDNEDQQTPPPRQLFAQNSWCPVCWFLMAGEYVNRNSNGRINVREVRTSENHKLQQPPAHGSSVADGRVGGRSGWQGSSPTQQVWATVCHCFHRRLKPLWHGHQCKGLKILSSSLVVLDLLSSCSTFLGWRRRLVVVLCAKIVRTCFLVFWFALHPQFFGVRGALREFVRSFSRCRNIYS